MAGQTCREMGKYEVDVILCRPVFLFIFAKSSVTYIILSTNKSVIDYCIDKDKEGIFMMFP